MTDPWNLLIQTPLWRPGKGLNEEQTELVRAVRADRKKPIRFDAGTRPFDLSPKELLAMRFFCEGYAIEEVAMGMSCAKKTAEEYLYRASKKIGGKNRTHSAILFDRAVRKITSP